MPDPRDLPSDLDPRGGRPRPKPQKAPAPEPREDVFVRRPGELHGPQRPPAQHTRVMHPADLGQAPPPARPESPRIRPESPPSADQTPGGGQPHTPDAGAVPASVPQPPKRRRRHRLRWIVLSLVLLLIVVIVGFGAYAYNYLDGHMKKTVTISDYAGRPGNGNGTNWLLAGSDIRADGSVGGARSDTIMLVHTGGGGTSIVSIPRDSLVTIPSYKDSAGKVHAESSNKINAAFSWGGPALLIKTVEANTGVRVDHYMGIDFGGLTSVVDKLGGVNVCVSQDMADRWSGLDVKSGCQTMNGATALAYSRDRHSDAQGDLGRVTRQRQVLDAIIKKSTSPGELANPFSALSQSGSTLATLSFDKNASPIGVARLGLALRGSPTQTTVPVSNAGYSYNGMSTVLWDKDKAHALFAAIIAGTKIPTS